jgi:hypothetical protein
MKNEGDREAGYVRRWVRTVAIDVCLLFKPLKIARQYLASARRSRVDVTVHRRIFFNVFPFPVCKAKVIDD